MRISPGSSVSYNNVSRLAVANKAQQTAKTPQTANVGNVNKGLEQNFDRVTIAADGSFQKGLQSRLSQEVRTATTTGTISSLREQVQSGAYQVDAQAIARKMLFVWEV